MVAATSQLWQEFQPHLFHYSIHFIIIQNPLGRISLKLSENDHEYATYLLQTLAWIWNCSIGNFHFLSLLNLFFSTKARTSL